VEGVFGAEMEAFKELRSGNYIDIRKKLESFVFYMYIVYLQRMDIESKTYMGIDSIAFIKSLE
jgi:hypothetical protein